MNCEQIQPKLLDYSRRQLSALDAKEVKEHLANCAECREELAREVALDRRLRSLPAAAPRTDLWPLIRTAVRGRQPVTARLRAAIRQPRRAVAGALAVAVAIMAIILASPALRPPVAPPETAAVAIHPAAQPVGTYDDPMGENTERILAAIEEGT